MRGPGRRWGGASGRGGRLIGVEVPRPVEFRVGTAAMVLGVLLHVRDFLGMSADGYRMASMG